MFLSFDVTYHIHSFHLNTSQGIATNMGHGINGSCMIFFMINLALTYWSIRTEKWFVEVIKNGSIYTEKG